MIKTNPFLFSDEGQQKLLIQIIKICLVIYTVTSLDDSRYIFYYIM